MNLPIYHFILSILLAIITVDLQAQTQVSTITEPCGTEFSAKQLQWLKAFRQQPTSYHKSADEPLYVPMQIHIVGSGDLDKPYGFYPAQEAYRVLCELNDDFSNTGIQFYNANDFHYIVKAGYYSQYQASQGAEMMSIHNVADAINVYIVKKAMGNCGYYMSGYDGIVVIKSCVEPGDNTLAHEVGHYFSLPHTFLGWENGKTPPVHQQELVDGSNCASSGDYFCDTKADYASKRWNCPYNGKPLYDPKGNSVKPDGSLFMSYSYDQCSYRFSPQQTAVMIGNLFQNRSYLLQNTPPQIAKLEQDLLLYPESAELPLPFEHVLLAWEAVEGANEYYVEVRNKKFIANVALPDTSFNTSDTSAMLKLDPYIIYNWSVQPLAENVACTKASKGQFSTTRARIIYVESFTMESPQCYGEAGGRLQIEVAGGTAPFTYLWNTGSTESFVENITGGVYNVVVKDAKGRKNLLQFNVPQPSDMAIRLTQTANGEAVAMVSGGSSPYELQWSNGMTTEIVEGLEAGVYELTAKDANGCEKSNRIQIVDFDVIQQNASCYGTKDGSIAFSFNDNTPDYQFDWNIGETTSFIEGLFPGLYGVVVTDGSLIHIEQNFTISNPEALHADISIDAEGTVCAEVTGGTPPYTFIWPNGITDQSCQSGLPDASQIPSPWKLSVVITDAPECFSELYYFEIPPPINSDKHASTSTLADLALVNFRLFPNPAMRDQKPQLQFELNHASKGAIHIFNSMGQLMYQQEDDYDLGVHTQYLDIRNWKSGLYLVKMEVNGISLVERLMVY